MEDLEMVDEQINNMMDRIELEGETCHLKHSKEDPSENHPVIDYLCQNLGDQYSGESIHQLRIPICKECLEALNDPLWILVYCTNCNNSQWIYRPYAKLNYPDGNGVYWLDVCPFCAEIANEYKEDNNV